MIEHLFDRYLPFFINILEAMGIIVIIIGSVKAFYHFLYTLFKKTSYPIKSNFAETLSMGLEFKLASEILKTVQIKTLDEIWIIAAVSLLRGFLSLLIYWEMKGEKDN
ncbi:MAG: DUF1622 domain-containing protein [Clostridiaceae bacterium]|nr:DUF1622 domain-containing protein [Clostridiaceae bacterium]